MPTYKSPGVYIEEISVFPPSIAAVDTAIPAFIGYTEKAVDENGASLEYIPTRITSLLEYQQYFGGAEVKAISVDVTQSGSSMTVTFDTAPGLPDQFLYYSMQLFYANGGGPCYVVSIGDYTTDATAPAQSHFLGAAGPPVIPNVFEILEALDEPTLLVFPDAVLLNDTGHAAIINAALTHCSKMQDRFTIADVRNAMPGQTDTNAEVTSGFRTNVTGDPRYGAAYFPYLVTSLPWLTDDTQITIASHNGAPAAETVTANTTLSTIKTSHTAVYNAVKLFTNAASVTIPASGGVAGVYARVDASRGVWKAPANAPILNVIEPAVKITNDLNDGLNIDATSGKSVNAIRAFTGKGTLVWGARTLDGNSNENRYVNVRRFLIFAEESIKKAIAAFVFESNDATTWVKVRSMIESFLTRQWRDGALAGAKPEHAFSVLVGLNKTMTPQDILEGYMIVEVRLAIVRPAEFIVLRFVQKLQES